ncbi:uncharacterized protein, partial [Salmo salar]|uniref:Uncharacterized protein n=1 Tax=Salmo salar TaxID=8030 RepID=A0ABM3EAD9_SALSA
MVVLERIRSLSQMLIQSMCLPNQSGFTLHTQPSALRSQLSAGLKLLYTECIINLGSHSTPSPQLSAGLKLLYTECIINLGSHSTLSPQLSAPQLSALSSQISASLKLLSLPNIPQKKNSYSQDTPHHPQPNGIKDQSRLLPRAASPAPTPPHPAVGVQPPVPHPGTGPQPRLSLCLRPDSGNGAGSNCSGTGAAASAQNPVLSKLLMADQDSPLDLTVKRPDPTETKTEDGVLDLSTKKAHGTVLKNSHSYTLSPTVKG